MNKYYIFDIDGTLTIQDDYLINSDYDSLFDECNLDFPEINVCSICYSLSLENNIIFLTERPEKFRFKTNEWINKNIGLFPCNYKLFMRKDEDKRSFLNVKEDIYLKEIEDKYEVIGLFENDVEAIELFNKYYKLTCFKV